jgi:hypothetical protein
MTQSTNKPVAKLTPEQAGKVYHLIVLSQGIASNPTHVKYEDWRKEQKELMVELGILR